MQQASFVVIATHAKNQEQLRLEVEEGQDWLVGRKGGSPSRYRWDVSFDPALSRDHLRFCLIGGVLVVEAVRNRHPLYFDGVSTQTFHLVPGSKFLTAHTVFEFQAFETLRSAAPATEDIDLSTEILNFTAMLRVLVQAGYSFGKVFPILRSHLSQSFQPILDGLEVRVLTRGEPLSRALQEYPQAFDDVYLALVELGESTGADRAWERLFRQLAREQKRRFRWREELAPACRILAEVLEGGGSEEKAVSLAAKVTQDELVRQAFLNVETQLKSGKSLADCQFPALFPPLLRALGVAHQALGNPARAFIEFAEQVED